MALQSTEIVALTVCVYGPCPSNDKTRLQAQDLYAYQKKKWERGRSTWFARNAFTRVVGHEIL